MALAHISHVGEPGLYELTACSPRFHHRMGLDPHLVEQPITGFSVEVAESLAKASCYLIGDRCT